MEPYRGRSGDAVNMYRGAWRLILEPEPLPGVVNLARDEAILRSVAARGAPPTLRIYTWHPAALVVGRGQPIAEVARDRVRYAGIDVLRRMTGGTAVLNRDVLSFSVAVPADEVWLATPVTESYRGLGEALLHAVQRLGVLNAVLSRYRSGAKVRSPVCFELPSAYELLVGGRKLVGMAQWRTRHGILLHGSLPLSGDVGEIVNYLAASIEPLRVRMAATTLAEALGRPVSWGDVTNAVIQGCAEVLDLDLVESPLCEAEVIEVERLIQGKYGLREWTEHL